jgi:hypothetical protein
MENTTYAIRCAETGTEIDTAIGMTAAKALLAQYEASDRAEGSFTLGFYEIVEQQYNYFYNNNAIRKSDFLSNVPINWQLDVKFGMYSYGCYNAYEKY